MVNFGKTFSTPVGLSSLGLGFVLSTALVQFGIITDPMIHYLVGAGLYLLPMFMKR